MLLATHLLATLVCMCACMLHFENVLVRSIASTASEATIKVNKHFLLLKEDCTIAHFLLALAMHSCIVCIIHVHTPICVTLIVAVCIFSLSKVAIFVIRHNTLYTLLIS